jgi:hypothetical protein
MVFMLDRGTINNRNSDRTLREIQSKELETRIRRKTEAISPGLSAFLFGKLLKEDPEERAKIEDLFELCKDDASGNSLW